MLKYTNILKNRTTMTTSILTVAAILFEINLVIYISEFSTPKILASSSSASLSNSTSNPLNNNQNTEKMITALLYSGFNESKPSYLKLESPLLVQTDHNIHFILLPNITGIVTEEVPFKGNGTIKGISYNHTGFFSGVWNLPHNYLQYYGVVNLTTVDGEEALYSLQGLSRVDTNGNVQGSGIAFFNTNSTGKISSLDGIAIFYNDEIKNPTASDSPHRITGWKIEY